MKIWYEQLSKIKMKKIAFLVEPSSQLYNLEKDDIFLVDSELIACYADGSEEKMPTAAIKNNYFELLKNSKKILTTIPPLGKVCELIEKLLTQYDLVIGVPLSKYLSSAYSVWKGIESDFNHKFHVVDVDDIEIGIKWTIQYIKEHVHQFETSEQLQQLLNQRQAHMLNYIVLTNIEKLLVSGRVSKFKSRVIELLNFKLILNLSAKEKKLTLCKKVLSIKSAINFFINKIKTNPTYKKQQSIKRIALLSSYQDATVIDEIIKDLKQVFDGPIAINRISPIVAAHTGINAFGIYVEVE